MVREQHLFVVDHIQIERWQMPTFALGVAWRQQHVLRYVQIILMVIQCSCKNAHLGTHMMPHGGECSIPGGALIFDNDYNAVSDGIPAEF